MSPKVFALKICCVTLTRWIVLETTRNLSPVVTFVPGGNGLPDQVADLIKQVFYLKFTIAVRPAMMKVVSMSAANKENAY